ncbi:MAG: T9SS type A sorting domain-containing protein [Candidatus Eisenbacteria bacterium]|nr:T9SS type A sorting domain-containing protein [Candidatus Eisenbacteria bacterium]
MKRAVFIALMAALLPSLSAAEGDLPPPTGLAASTDSCWGIYLSWDSLPDADSFYVRRGTNVFHVQDLFFRDTLAPAGSSQYWVAGFGSHGLGDSADVTGFRPSTPSAPASISASDTSCAMVRLDWSASAEADSYRVWRNGAPIATVDATVLFYEDGPPPGPYLYGVSAGSACGWSDSATATGERLDLPAPPGSVAASDTSCHFILVTWTDAPDEEGYRIYRDGAATPVAEPPADATAWADETVEAGVTHSYRVASVNRCGEASGGTAAGERIFGYPESPVNVEASDGRCDSIVVTWATATEPAGADSFIVYHREVGGAPAWIRVGAVTAPPYRVAHAPAPGTYAYYVAACNHCGCTPAAAASQDEGSRDAPPAGAPAFTSESDAEGCAGAPFRLVWKGVQGATSYTVIEGAIETPVGADTSWVGSLDGPGAHLFRVRAENHCGAGPESDPWEVKILIGPGAPATIVATDTLCGAVRLDWSASANADSYRVWRDGAPVTILDGAALSWVDSIAAGTYIYGVSAGNACGWSDSAVASGTSAGIPAAPSAVAASDTSCSFIYVTWSASADADSYRVWRDGAPAATLDGAATAYEDTVASGAYLYGVSAGNRCGWSDSTVAEGSTLPAPVPPAAVAASDTSCLFVFVAWDAVADADSYRVWRDGAPIAALDAPAAAYRDTVAPGAYLYGVSSRNTCGWSDSTVAEGRVLGVPAAPSAVTASDTACARIVVSWSASADADSYRVWRDGAPAATLGATIFTYEDSVPPGGYAYAVSAGNRCGWSDSTASIGLSLGPPPPLAALAASDDSCGFVRLVWGAVADADSYAVYRDGIPVAVIAETTLVDTAPPDAYLYAVAARNRCGDSPAAQDSGTRPPDPPQPPAGLSASSDSCGFVFVAWSPAADAISYDVLREGIPLGATADTLYRDDTALAGASYLYTVRASNSCGVSEESGAVTGARPPGPPAAPDSTGASTNRCDGILVSWTDVENEEWYVVLRDEAAADTLPAETLSWLDEAATPGTHVYRVGAFNGCSAAPSFGDSAEGFLLPAPPPVVDLDADSICGGVRLSWSDVDWEAGYVVVRRQDEEGVALDTLGADATFFEDFTADTGAVYEYGVGVFNGCHPEPAFGSWATGIRPWDGPAPPVGVSAGDGNCGSIRVDWLRSAHADGYRVFRDNVMIAVTESPLFADGEASPGTHLYKVKAYNSCDVSGFSDADAGSRPPDAPAPPENPNATDNNCKHIRVSWNDTANEDGYRIYRDGAGIPIIVLGPNTTSYEDNAVESGTHTYRIEAYNSCGVGSAGPVMGERILGYPMAPTDVSASDDRCDDILVTWSYPAGEMIDSFVVSFRDPAQTPNWEPVGVVYGAPLRYVHAPAPGSYEYRVVAFNECGSSPETAGSVDAGVRRGAPGVPADFTALPAEVCGGRPFTLSWRPVEGALSYELEEMEAGTTNTTDTSVTLTRPDAGTSAFRVRATGACGAGEWSGVREVEIQVLPEAPASPSATGDRCGAIRLGWTSVGTGGVWIETGTGTVFLDGPETWTDSLPEGGARSYPIGGWNACDTLAASDTVSGYAFPLALDAPDNVTASDGLCDSVEVKWDWNGDAVAVDSFRVVRYDGPLTSVIAVTDPSSPFRAVDRNAAAGRRYVYRVRALGRCAQAVGAPDTGWAETRPGSPTWDNPQSAACAGVPYLLRWTEVEGAEEYLLREAGSLVAVVDTIAFPLLPNGLGTFVYEVIARSGCGEGEPSDPWVLLVGEAPSPPSGVILDSSFCDSVVIEWEAQEDSVRIYRSDRVAPVWSGPGDGRFVDSPGRAVTYQLHGFNGCGESEGTAVALLRPRIRPASPASVTASNGFCDSVVVTWSFPSSDATIRRIEVRRARNDTTIVVADSLPPASRRFVDRGGEGTYTYEVCAVNVCGVSLPEETSRDDGGFLPTAPRGRFTSDSDAASCVGDSFYLFWEPWEGALDYRLSETVGSQEFPLATLGAGTTEWGGLAAAEGERAFRIRARGACGFGEKSDPWIVFVAGSPDPPVGLTASQGLCGRVRLAWRAGGSATERVAVYRDGGRIAEVEPPDTFFVDSTVTDGVTYAYEAAMENHCGASERSGPVAGASLPGLAPPVQEAPEEDAADLPVPVTLRWSAVEGAAGYTVRVEPAAGGAATTDTTLGAGETAFLLFGVEPGGSYRWRAATRSGCGVGVPSAWRAFSVGGAAPAALATRPLDGEIETPADVVIRVQFNFPIDPEGLASVRLLRGDTETAGEARLEENGAVLFFEPASPLAFGADYLFLFDGLRDAYGRPIEGRRSIAFTTQPALRPFGDLNGDYRRDLRDVLLADSILIGLRGVAPLPIDLVDLNGDYRFNVADMVMLGHALVEQGPSAPAAETALLPARIGVAAEPGDLPGRFRLILDIPVGSGAAACYLEVRSAGGSGRLISADAADDGSVRAWRAVAGGFIRALFTVEGGGLLPAAGPGEARIILEWEGAEPPERLRVERLVLGGGAEGQRFLAAGSPSVGRAEELRLVPNRPNPFNPFTEIHFYLPEPGDVRVVVYDLSGRVVAVLAEGPERSGWRVAAWDGRNRAGEPVASGTYFCRVECGARTRAIRMTLLR